MFPNLGDVFVTSIIFILCQITLATPALTMPTNTNSLSTKLSQVPSETTETKQPHQRIAEYCKLKLKFYSSIIKKIPRETRSLVQWIIRELTEEIAENQQKLEDLNEKTKVLSNNITALIIDKKNAERQAAVLEFLLVSRKELELISKFAKNCPDHNKFADEMKKKSEFTNIKPELLTGGKHFRNLLWLLGTLDPLVSEQVEKLRELLGRDPKRYIWFANQGQSLYDFFFKRYSWGRSIIRSQISR